MKFSVQGYATLLLWGTASAVRSVYVNSNFDNTDQAMRSDATTTNSQTTRSLASTFAPILINCGGSNYTDSLGRHWLADRFFLGGATYVSNVGITGTVDDSLYNCERYGPAVYSVPVPPGTYTVVLHFAEIYHTATDARVFGIDVEGQLLPNLDIVKLGGEAFKAVTQTLAVVSVLDGFLTVGLLDNTPIIDNPKISAIEVRQVVPTPTRVTKAPITAPVVAPLVPTTTTQASASILINCGAAVSHTDALGRVWSADQYFIGGFTYDSNVAISNTTEDALYNCERYGRSTYQIPVPTVGTYTVVLHFAEIYHTLVGERIFTIGLEAIRLTDIDIVQLGGGVAFKAITQTVKAVLVSDGFLTIQLLNHDPVNDMPKLSAIEIHQNVVIRPSKAPVPVVPPTRAPVRITVPTNAPIPLPIIVAPKAPHVPLPFQPVRINCGGTAYNDTSGRRWQADEYFVGGLTFNSNAEVAGTSEDSLYNCERYGQSIYQIPVPIGSFTVTLHFAEIYHATVGKRVFNVVVEGQSLFDVDIVALGGGVAFKAITQVIRSVIVEDGFLTLKFNLNTPAIDLPKISAIEVRNASTSPTAPAPIVAPIAKPQSVPVAKAPVQVPSSPIAKAPVSVPLVVPAAKAPVPAPTTPIAKAPVSVPFAFPVAKAPVFAPLGVPVAKAPVPAPTTPIAKAPVSVPFAFPAAKAPVFAPVTVPVAKSPVSAPLVKLPTKAPIIRPNTLAPRASPAFTPIRINCGGAAYNDTKGRRWQADNFFIGGLTFDSNVEIADTLEDPIYNCERYGQSIYQLPVPLGTYTVTLHFAEIFHTTVGKRVFDVSVEGRAIPDVDIVKIGGGVSFKAITSVNKDVSVLDGLLTIEFTNNVPFIDLPKISAIEVTQGLVNTKAPTLLAPNAKAPAAPLPTVKGPIASAPVAPTFAPILINCGGTNFTDSKGRKWIGDSFFTGGLVYADGNVDVAATIDDNLYNKERYGQSTYQIPIPSGTFSVVLHMAEIFHKTVGSRVFDVQVEGVAVPDVDIVQLGGAFRAVTKVVSPVEVVDGFMTIHFNNNVPMIDYPKISAIEINTYSMVIPTQAPITPPVPMRAPIPVSPVTPVAGPPTASAPFTPILITCGGTDYVDTQGRLWSADKYFNGGNTYFNGANPILGTGDDIIYQGERFGAFSYEIPIPAGDYEAVFHFAEIYFTFPRSRIFDINVEGKLISDVDIVQQAGGKAFRAITRETPVTVTDGFISIQFLNKEPAVSDPKVSAIEIRRVGPHYAHAVTGGPYVTVDTDDSGSALVHVDSSESHTHGPGQVLTSFTWKEGAKVLGKGEVTDLELPIGEHDVTLTVVDSSGDMNIDITTMTVRRAGYPVVNSLFPNTGDIAGGDKVTIIGAALSTVSVVRFGLVLLSDITVINATAITVKVPASGFGVPVSVSAITPAGESNAAKFTYVNSAPIAFTVEKLLDFATPTSVAFGPDGKLYVGSTNGQLGRFTLNDSYDRVISSVISTVDATRGIHSIAFDPMETAELGVNINCYISTSKIFHLEYRNSIGDGINGKIQTVKGANLDIITDIVTGLPVSELDHGVNGIHFGDNGELYIAIGSNTNGGIPGELSATRLMRENYFSAAVLVANLGQVGFDGFIKYSAPIDGDPIAGFGAKGVEVFAAGLRNPFGVLYHSSGKVYGTENGPNPGFGDMATGCGVGQQIPDAYDVDELNLLKRGGYYGHPNFKRAEKDPRQCVWRSSSIPSGNGYTAPLMKLTSSTDGIIEFESDHFNGQMRGDLIVSKYTDGLFRVILSPDGETVNRSSDPAIPLVGDNGLSVAQAPDGTLVDARYTTNNCYFFRPIEAASTDLDIKAVFPRRGALAGGTKLAIFGVNFKSSPTVTVGGKPCTKVVLVSAKKIECILPMGTVGKKDVVVTVGVQSDTFTKGYRYITGKPVVV